MDPCTGADHRSVDVLGFSRGLPGDAVPDSDIGIVGKTWALPEGSQRSRHTTVLSIQVSQWISLKLFFVLAITLQPGKVYFKTLTTY